MAGNRKGGDSNEGTRALPKTRREESTEAERKLDSLAEEGLPENEALPETDDTGTDLTGAQERSLRQQRERISEQARLGPRSVKDPEQPT